MKGDLICVNGKLAQRTDADIDHDRLMGCNFIYDRIHVLNRKPLHAATHIELTEASYRIMYGGGSGLTAQILAKEIETLLTGNRYANAGNLVTLYLIPPTEGETRPVRILSCERQMLYKGYALWHNAVRAVVTPYEYPFAHHRTAVSLAAHNYSADFALRKGADMALTKNYAGIVTSAGEYPLFAVVRDDVFTAPLDEGLPDSVERRLGIAASANAGWHVSEKQVEADSLKSIDELFYVTPQGVVSVGAVDGRPYPSSAAKTIAATMAAMTNATL